jgi:iron(III) transport system ATP-binding protein
MTTSFLVVEDLRHQFATLPVLKNLSLNLKTGEIGCLLGSSGCGKTTALRAIAGFIRPDYGSIRIDGETVFSASSSSTTSTWLAPEQRGVGVVFQDFALFPHLTVAQNIAFGLHKLPAIQRQARVNEVLQTIGLLPYANHYPHELSGGQQQRVALARALAPKPRLLLLDEPFSSLDPDLRERLALEVRELIKAANTTALLVTHDQYEAFAMADKIGVMQDGRIVQWDEPYELYHRPHDTSVAKFVGEGVIMPARIKAKSLSTPNAQVIEIELGELTIHSSQEWSQVCLAADERGELSVLMRPDDVVHDDASALKAEVIRKAFRGAHFLYTLHLPSGRELLALVPSHHDHAIGEHIGIRFDADHVVAFNPREDQADHFETIK